MTIHVYDTYLLHRMPAGLAQEVCPPTAWDDRGAHTPAPCMRACVSLCKHCVCARMCVHDSSMCVHMRFNTQFCVLLCASMRARVLLRQHAHHWLAMTGHNAISLPDKLASGRPW